MAERLSAVKLVGCWMLMLSACAAPALSPPVSLEAARQPDVAVWKTVVEFHELPPIQVEPAPVPAASPPPEVVTHVPAPIDPRTYAPVLADLPDHLMISSDMSTDLPHSPPQLARPGFKTVITRAAVATKDLPDELAAWIGAKVQLMGAKGLACETTVRSLELVARYSPLAYTVDQWLGRVVVPGIPRPTAPQIAKIAFDERGANIMMTAKVDLPAGCTGALWGRWATSPAPVATAASPNAASSYDYGAAFRTLPSYLQFQAEYQTVLATSQLESTGYWSDDRGLKVTAFEPPHANRLVYLTTRATDDRYGGAISSIFEETSRGLEPLMEGGSPHPVVSLVDVDGDGSAELVGTEVLVRIHRQTEVVQYVPFVTVESEGGC